MDERELLDAIKKIERFNRLAQTDRAARWSVQVISNETIRKAESDPPGIPVLGRVDGTGRVTFFKD